MLVVCKRRLLDKDGYIRPLVILEKFKKTDISVHGKERDKTIDLVLNDQEKRTIEQYFKIQHLNC